MKSVIFMGSPDFAVPALKALLDSNDYDVKLVVSQTDKPQGRKQIMTAPPVKELALQYNVPVFQPKTLKTQESFETLAALAPDFIVVAAYGKILPQSVLDLPKYGCVNLHGSLLPKYRGAAPIQWSVLNGEQETGVTTMLMDAGIDTGDILLTAKTPIGPDETAGELFDRLAAMCPALLFETLQGLENGSIVPKKQEESAATYVSVLDKTMAVLDFSRSAQEIHNAVRGLNPWPVAKTSFEGKNMKIYSGRLTGKKTALPHGALLAEKESLFVACGGELYQILELQLEGAKRMTADLFLRGHNGVNKIILG